MMTVWLELQPVTGNMLLSDISHQASIRQIKNKTVVPGRKWQGTTVFLLCLTD